MQDFLCPVLSLCERRSYREFYPGFSWVTFSVARPDFPRSVSHCVRGGATEKFIQDFLGNLLGCEGTLGGVHVLPILRESCKLRGRNAAAVA